MGHRTGRALARGLDMLSGRKPLWLGGPTQLNLQRFEPVEFVIEGTLLYGGWHLLGRREPLHTAARRTVLAALLLGEVTYLTTSLQARPHTTRCIDRRPHRVCPLTGGG